MKSRQKRGAHNSNSDFESNKAFERNSNSQRPASAHSKFKHHSKNTTPNASNTSNASSASNAQKGAYWLYGFHPSILAIQNPNRHILEIKITQATHERINEALGSLGSLESLGSRRDLPRINIVDRHQLDRLCGADAVHQGVALCVLPQRAVDGEQFIINALEARSKATLLILDQVTDPRNIGAIMRSAAAFGVVAVIVQDKHSPGESAVMAKAAAGAMDTLPLLRTVNLTRFIEFLKSQNFWVYGMDGAASTAINQITPAPYQALVVGAEGAGIRHKTKQICDDLVKIPIDDHAMESLNVSNAASVALYALTT